MTEQEFFTPLKVGLLIVVVAYFLFTLHAMFTLSWIGEWNRLGSGSFGTIIFVEDISGEIGLVFRFIASILALAALIFYFAKKDLSKPTAYTVARWVLVFEGIYWLGLIATAGYSVQSFWNLLSSTLLRHRSLDNVFNNLLTSVIPTVVESVILPIVLFIFAFKLNPNKPLKAPIKWGLITGTIYIVVFWLVNMSIWLGVTRQKGMAYLTSNPEYLISYVLTVFGLLLLAIFTGYFAKKSAGTETLQKLKLGTIGAITTALGLYFLWNYLSWVILAGIKWSNWYAWFLGHNMDLWMLSLPLLGIPLLFAKKDSKENSSSN